MKSIILITFFSLGILSCKKEFTQNPQNYNCSLSFTDSSSANPNNALYQQLLNEMVASGVPGISMAVFTAQQGMWLGVAGKADLGHNINMQPCNITRMGSTVKTFTAVTILKLKEEGLLALDDKLADHLPAEVWNGIANAGNVSIRQLLQHSGGLYNYIQNPSFQTASLNNLKRIWQPDELLQYARGKAAYFNPGDDVRYSNTGYILLGMVIEKVTGKKFWQVFKEKIFEPLQLNSTSFAATDPVPAGIIRGYVDFCGKMQLTDATYFSGWDYYTADGGLISTPYDLNAFFTSLMSEQLLSTASMREMLTIKSPVSIDTDFFPIGYGLGIFKVETPWGQAWLHSGDAIGYYAAMAYFPARQTTIVWAVNGNYGKIDELVSGKKAMEKIFDTVF
ncbi:MAG: serine hydrolase domain-containing protein [Ferruginibacter sp.]